MTGHPEVTSCCAWEGAFRVKRRWPKPIDFDQRASPLLSHENCTLAIHRTEERVFGHPDCLSKNSKSKYRFSNFRFYGWCPDDGVAPPMMMLLSAPCSKNYVFK